MLVKKTFSTEINGTLEIKTIGKFYSLYNKYIQFTPNY
jgi:hypothetical protein